MSYRERIKHLERLHEQIDQEIDNMEKNHPHVDETRVHNMKKQRLQYLDELRTLRKIQWEEDHERTGYGEER